VRTVSEGAGPRGLDIDRWLPWSHIVLCNFKRWTLHSFHGVSPGHLQAYLDKYCYRLNRCVLYTDPAPYALLTAT